METLASLKPIQHQTGRGQIVHQMRELIVNGRVVPGERLIETDLATPRRQPGTFTRGS